jgi:phage replication O-like protein O
LEIFVMPKNQTTSRFQGFRSPNYTQVPDELFDELMADLSGTELKVLLYIMRRTFGFKKDQDNISLNQICNGITRKNGKVIDRGTGLSKASAARALKSLEEKGIILRSRRRSAERGDEATTYQLNIGGTPVSQNETPPLSQNQTRPRVSKVNTQDTELTQQTDFNHSNTRKESSQKNEKVDEAAQRRPQPDQPSQPEVRYEEFVRLQPSQPQESPPTARASSDVGSTLPVTESPVSAPPRGLSRQYLREARAKSQQQPRQAAGMTALASLLPEPDSANHPYPEERQVLVDVIADLAREFHDEAELTSSVSRAYNLMQQAKISDIGVFTSKIYEARSITKERYGTITRRMPYFFSVLQDICGLKQKPSGQTADSA